MGQHAITYLKSAIEQNLRAFLQEEGIEFFIAANDNAPFERPRQAVMLESINHTLLKDDDLLHQIQVILRVQGKPWQCEALINGIYLALQPHYITQHDLTILLMSFHVEAIARKPRKIQKRAIMRYIVESGRNTSDIAEQANRECLMNG